MATLAETVDKLISKLIVTRLRDLIKAIRQCKTAAEERAVIARESAFIRTSFKEDNSPDMRYINVQKLLYIHMLGYPAHFGQMECLKLVASPRFADKKLGYLGIMLLMDESQEVLTLVTNSLKNDMNNSNMHIVGIALCTLGNISSTEMSRDLCGEVEKLLASSNAFIRKKAALCALRMIKKVPDLMENFVGKAKGLLNERNHSVLMTGITLLVEMCKQDSAVLNSVRSSVPVLVRHLKNLVTTGFSPEHDVSGITDPFLQVKILRLMRILGKGDAQASDSMNDVLAQVATNTEATKNVGNAILYETVLTIMDIESENSLRVMAVNILGKFLTNRDNNIRYVALTTLTKTAQMTEAADASALQRHRATILDCLRDPDITIRRRALDLSFFLINSSNIRILTRELLSFLEVAEGDIKSSTATRICEFSGRHRPNKRWELDTVIRVLRVAGSHVDQSTIDHAVKLVTTSDVGLQQYAVRKMYNVVRMEGDRALAQEGLLQVMGWCVGEFGDMLVEGGTTGSIGINGDEDASADSSDYQLAPTEKDVVETFDVILRGPFATASVKEYFVSALVKLLGRFRQESVLEFIRSILAKYRTHQEVEIQARAIEFSAVAQLDSETRVALLERMPVLESALKEEALKGTGLPAAGTASSNSSPTAGSKAANVLDLGNDLVGLSLGSGSSAAASTAAKPADDLLSLMFGGAGSGGSGSTTAAPKNDNIMDILGGLGSTPAPSKPAGSTQASAPMNDLLGDLFGGSTSAPSAAPKSSLPSFGGNAGAATRVDAFDIFGGGGFGAPAAAKPSSYKVYEKNGFRINITPTREDGGTAMSLSVLFENVSGGVLSGLVFQVAVTKALKLSMQAPSAVVIAPGKTASQILRIENPTRAVVKLRMKIGYSINGQQTEEIADFAGFDSSLWATQ